MEGAANVGLRRLIMTVNQESGGGLCYKVTSADPGSLIWPVES